MDSRATDEISVADLFDQFIEASTMKDVLATYHRILNFSDLSPCEFNVFFPKLKRAVMGNRARKNWKAKALFSKIDKKSTHRCYSNTKTPTPLGNRTNDSNGSSNSRERSDECISSQSHRNNNALQDYSCLVIGSGPAGLRTAIELQLLGASRVVVVEKRNRFSRNNVLHLWPFVIDDLKSLGAKKFYGKFCAGSIDHISIRQLQLILLKICLMIGCDFRDSCSYICLCPTTVEHVQQVTGATEGDNEKADSSSDIMNEFECDFEAEQQPVLGRLADTLQAADNEMSTGKVPDLDETVVERDTNLVEQQVESLPSAQEIPKVNMETKCPDMAGEQIDNEIIKPIVINVTETNQRRKNMHGARAHFQSDDKVKENELHSYEWDIIIGADGRRNTLSKYFPRKEFRGRLAIAITANFINRQTPAEASVSEISGLSFIYNQDMFNALAYDTNIQLENICYYKDDTHYFVMTAKKKSLLERGVLIKDFATTLDLLSKENVDKQALFKYAKDAAFWTTGLEPLDFALNHYGEEDCTMFDFTSMYAASNACKALRTKRGGLALISLVGDSLLEPFWPTGSGCARGFLSSFDAAWMCRQWAVNRCAIIDYHSTTSSRSSRHHSSNSSEGNRSNGPTTYDKMALSVMAERESIYRILAQTTSENLQQNYALWTLNPHSRYPNLNRHLVIPSQVEHLIIDYDSKNHKIIVKSAHLGPQRNRLIKSPNSNSRKSPKKMKSADASPLAQPKNSKGRSKSASRQSCRPKSRHDLLLDSTYLEFEESYRNLANQGDVMGGYSNRRPDCDTYDDCFIPSISGALPSSNNLLNLEARRAREIDDCLRQRRQKTRLSAIRDQLFEQFQGDSPQKARDPGKPVAPNGSVLFNELRRLREQQSNGKENKMKDLGRPLSLFNSMRRCASFAERVKSFESKLDAPNHDSFASTPKTPIDKVKNLPEFATLQEFFVGNSTCARPATADCSKKAKIPIMKLSKDDWNVKCWEKRPSNYKQKNSSEFNGSSKSLNKALSVDSYQAVVSKPEKKVEVFKNRIKQMADKLEETRSDNPPPHTVSNYREKCTKNLGNNQRSQGWVSHLRSELIKDTESKRPQNTSKQAVNNRLLTKPVRRLFEDDDPEEDGIDVNKHYDHLCINRPTNKYLPKNGYKSHLVRTKYSSETAKCVSREPKLVSKQTQTTILTSRGSSASSTLSDCSTNTGGFARETRQQRPNVKCSRCKTCVDSGDMISFGDSVLHRTCLICADCGITLRTNEIQHYLRFSEDADFKRESSFFCAICKPNIRQNLTREAAHPLITPETNFDSKSLCTGSRLKSREDFLSETIDYSELYRNILNANSRDTSAAQIIEKLAPTSQKTSTNKQTTPTCECLSADNDSTFQERGLEAEPSRPQAPSPLQVTLPLKLISEAREQDWSPRHIDIGLHLARQLMVVSR